MKERKKEEGKREQEREKEKQKEKRKEGRKEGRENKNFPMENIGCALILIHNIISINKN